MDRDEVTEVPRVRYYGAPQGPNWLDVGEGYEPSYHISDSIVKQAIQMDQKLRSRKRLRFEDF